MTHSTREAWLQSAVEALDYKALGRQAWHEARAALEAEWRAWLAQEYLDATADSTSAKLVWAKAWSDGHASGYGEVEYHYQELAELVKAVRE